MDDTSLYISPEYNPHSLIRDWGFFVEQQRPDIYAALSGPLSPLRQTLAASITTMAGGEFVATPTTSGKVTTDFVVPDARTMCQEVGLDVLTLALLADVPLHRPLQITQNALIGHWRWLRLVWRTLADAKPATRCVDTMPATPKSTFATLYPALVAGRSNVAIANLRTMFQNLTAHYETESVQNSLPESQDALHSFLANLTLFCPFIGYDLLCRHGLMKAPWIKGSIE
ncbi:hypothetical protein [Thalassospira lucentensis]|uniref:hypothetical protein n=1 Tax=Thalassospira lucentensis TaxID=168935 RepID=UPI0003B323F8|nr:hypothetical protein [Thalassospira lucentensis]RCK19690.1 hypothetical protein TH1_20685 [Thalassospira lucentensis MCCC 1A00383 = DSM 14000]